MAELLDWVEGVSTAAQQARDKGNITLDEALENTRFKVYQGYLAELHHQQNQAVDDQEELSTDDQINAARPRVTVRCAGCAGMFSELGHFAAGGHGSPQLDLRRWYVNPPPIGGRNVLTLLSSGDHGLGNDRTPALRCRPDRESMACPRNCFKVASRLPTYV